MQRRNFAFGSNSSASLNFIWQSWRETAQAGHRGAGCSLLAQLGRQSDAALSGSPRTASGRIAPRWSITPSTGDQTSSLFLTLSTYVCHEFPFPPYMPPLSPASALASAVCSLAITTGRSPASRKPPPPIPSPRPFLSFLGNFLSSTIYRR